MTKQDVVTQEPAPLTALFTDTQFSFFCASTGWVSYHFCTCSFVQVIHVLLRNILHKSGLAARKAMGGPKGGTPIREKQWANTECLSEYYFINIIIFFTLSKLKLHSL